jgi:hypothetical protein
MILDQAIFDHVSGIEPNLHWGRPPSSAPELPYVVMDPLSGSVAEYDSSHVATENITLRLHVWGNELDAFTAIGCLDTDFARDPDAYETLEPQFRTAAPRMWPLFTHSTQCAYWSAAPDPRIAVTGAGAGTIVVIGTTGDAATPLAGTRAMAAALEDGRLIVVEADRHTGYGVNDCVVSAVNDYLLTTKVTFAEKRC